MGEVHDTGVGIVLDNQPEQSSIVPSQPAGEHHLRNRIILAGTLLSAGALLGVGATVVYQHNDYVAADSCTDIDSISVNNLPATSVSAWSEAMHTFPGGVINLFRSNPSIRDEVLAVDRGYTVDMSKVVPPAGTASLDEPLPDGFSCIHGVGPTTEKIGDVVLVKGTAAANFWSAINSMPDESSREKYISAVAAANAKDIASTHTFPESGWYVWSAAEEDALLQTPGLTAEAKDAIQQQVTAMQLIPESGK